MSDVELVAGEDVPGVVDVEIQVTVVNRQMVEGLSSMFNRLLAVINR